VVSNNATRRTYAGPPRAGQPVRGRRSSAFAGNVAARTSSTAPVPEGVAGIVRATRALAMLAWGREYALQQGPGRGHSPRIFLRGHGRVEDLRRPWTDEHSRRFGGSKKPSAGEPGLPLPEPGDIRPRTRSRPNGAPNRVQHKGGERESKKTKNRSRASHLGGRGGPGCRWSAAAVDCSRSHTRHARSTTRPGGHRPGQRCLRWQGGGGQAVPRARVSRRRLGAGRGPTGPSRPLGGTGCKR